MKECSRSMDSISGCTSCATWQYRILTLCAYEHSILLPTILKVQYLHNLCEGIHCIYTIHHTPALWSKKAKRKKCSYSNIILELYVGQKVGSSHKLKEEVFFASKPTYQTNMPFCMVQHITNLHIRGSYTLVHYMCTVHCSVVCCVALLNQRPRVRYPVPFFATA